MNALIVATIAIGLLVDQWWAGPGQHVVNAAAWLVFALLWWRSPPGQRPLLLACLLFATAGEVFLSLAWGLYDYRLGNIPLFVPPGHVLLFYLGHADRRAPAGAQRMVDRRGGAAGGRGLRGDRARYAGPPALPALRRLPVAVALAPPLRHDVRARARDGALRDVARELDVGSARAVAGPCHGQSAARGGRLLLRAGLARGGCGNGVGADAGAPLDAGGRLSADSLSPGSPPASGPPVSPQPAPD